MRYKIAQFALRVTLLVAISTARGEEAATVGISDAHAKRRPDVTRRWLADEKMPADEIEKEEFLRAAVKFADTAVQYGKDTYGKEHMPLFSDMLNVDYLEAPRGIGSSSSTQPGPIVSCYFNNQQNLLRLLASLSLITGERKYVDAAYDATAFMFEHYQEKSSGLFYWGGHCFIDLDSGKTYGNKGEVHEIEDVFPFWEFILAVDPEGGERLIKGMWEAHLRSWSSFTYNRHAAYGRSVDFSRTWKRPWNGYQPGVDSGLSFQSIMLDCSFGAFSLGFVNRDEEPIAWAERFVDAFIIQRDRKSKIWPHLSHRQGHRDRGLQLYGDKYPNASEQNLYVGNIIEYVPRYGFGGLAVVESAQRHGYASRIKHVQQAVEDNILGYMTHAYNPQNHTMKHIINDGTDVTGYVFRQHGYFGAKAGGAFVRYRVAPLYHAMVARAYRLSGGRHAFWDILRDLFRGAKLGQIPDKPDTVPKFDYTTTTAEPGYAFALVDMYRATKNQEYLRFAEQIGRNIIKYRQHRGSGLFTLENSRVVYPGLYAKGSPLNEPHEQKTVLELFGKRHKTAALDVQEPLALLSIYAARTGQSDKAPMWVCGALYADGRAFSSGHVIGLDWEIWFDKPALAEFYQKYRRPYRMKDIGVGQSIWNYDGNSNWETNAHWLDNIKPGASDAVLIFGDVITADRTIQGPRDWNDWLAGMVFDAPHLYRIANVGGGLLFRQDFTITVRRGNHQIDINLQPTAKAPLDCTFNVASGSTFTYDGLLFEYSDQGYRSGLIKKGHGTAIVTADYGPIFHDALKDNRAYQRDTVIAAGTLLVNNASGTGISPRSTVHVQATGTLGGEGAISGKPVHLEADGTIAPGCKIGTLTLNSGLILEDGCNLSFALGKKSDLLRVTGGTLTGTGRAA